MMMVWRVTAAAAALSLFVTSSAFAIDDQPAIAVSQYGTWGFDLTGRDLAVKSGADFFLYANGNWIKHTEIPADKSSYGNFDKLHDLSEAIVRKLIEDAAAGHSNDPDAAKIGATYRSYMDETRVEQLDVKPLDNGFAAIRAEKTKEDVAALMGTAPKGEQPSIFSVSISSDDKAPDRYAVFMGNGGFGLPDRDYFMQPQFADKKAKYQTYVALMLRMVGWAEPDINAQAVVDFETRLAEASWPLAEQRDPNKTYNPMTPTELSSYAPGFDFTAFLKSADLGAMDRVIVSTNTAFPNVAKIFDATPLDTLKAWQAFHLVNGSAFHLSKRFVDANFDFYGKTIGGQPENRPRWKRAVSLVNGSLSDSVARMYVAKNFPPESKAALQALVKELVGAMHKRIAALDWMSPETKAKAQEKLSQMTVKIGYPDKWRDYGPLKMSADDLFGNSTRSAAYEWNYQVERLSKPVDKTEWTDQAPQTVNAGYDPSKNDITFPAAILQPPYFDPKADIAVNYGGIGAVIGHEITHGFDDVGRNYDGKGMLVSWWTAEDAAKFKSQADRLASQFDKFEPVKGYFVNGQLTMGENIADLGGVLLALDAYHAALNGKDAPVLDGLTGDQRLFIGNAQVWRSKVRDEAAIQGTKTDPHSPPQFRINGPNRNIDAWYAAFKVGPGDPMYIRPEQRVKIW